MEYDVAVIGSGPGGYIAAIECAQRGFKTACIEKDATLGGTCLNVGCIPSKTLLHASALYTTVKEKGATLGITTPQLGYNFQQMMQHKSDVIISLNAGVSALLASHNVTVIHDEARFISPDTLALASGTTLQARHYILATGSTPLTLPFLPFDETTIVSSTGALALNAPPKRLTVIGAGVIGVELASVYNRLGSSVTLIEALGQICNGIDPAIAKTFQKILTKQGLRFILNTQVTEAAGTHLTLSNGDTIDSHVVLVAIGRVPNSASLNLDAAGVATSDRGSVTIDSFYRTSQPHIYAIGDLTPGPMLAHRASEDGAAVAAIIANQTTHVNYATVPNVIYTDPEVATTGFTEEEARHYGISPITSSSHFKANSRARAAADSDGFVKVVADAATHRLIGVHIIGSHASEMIAEAVVAINMGATLEQLIHTSHPHPTLSETILEAFKNTFQHR